MMKRTLEYIAYILPKQCWQLRSSNSRHRQWSAGEKYPGAALASIRPAKGVSLEAAEASLMQELARLSNDGLTAKELERIKTVPFLTCQLDGVV